MTRARRHRPGSSPRHDRVRRGGALTPDHRSARRPRVDLRPAALADCDGIAALEQARYGTAIDDGVDHCRREVADDRICLLVAVAGPTVVAFGRAAWFEQPPSPAEGTAPSGWYLLGLIVDPPWRRIGLGTRLTAARLRWIAQRADEAYFFTNARNTASLDLHAKLGFVELTRAFVYPGAKFDGGVGVLGRVALEQ